MYILNSMAEYANSLHIHSYLTSCFIVLRNAIMFPSCRKKTETQSFRDYPVVSPLIG